MAQYEILKQAVANVIKTNGNNEITGTLLQSTLITIINLLGAHYQYVAIANPQTDPGTPDQNVFYVAFQPGTYSNFGGIVVGDNEVAFLKYNGAWIKDTTGAATASSVSTLLSTIDELESIVDAQNAQIDGFIETVTNQLNNFQPIIINGDVVNAPDQEDITTDQNDLLKFANRGTLNGLGYFILRRDKTFAQQVTLANTIYEIRYDFALSANFTMPDGCELRFNGGSIDGDNHTLTMTRTLISGNGKFVDCNFAGTILNDSVRISWFTNGMSNTTDYSVDHAPILISAMKLTSCKLRQGWLDLERIPLCIKQTVVISNPFGNIGMKNGLFYFVSSSDRQAMFDYQQTAQYQGNYSPIVDTTFYDVGDHYDTCVIKKTNWSDTSFSYWRDINASGFTGHFFVTNSYIQEVTFENITLDGFGMFSTNSDGLYSGSAGSGNIINFLNCNINSGSSTSKTTIEALYDLSNCIEVTIHNAVSQGRIGGSNIYPIVVRNSSTMSTNRTNIVLDGFWLEFVDGHVLKSVYVYASSCKIVAKRNSVGGLKTYQSNVTFDFQVEGGIYGYSIWENFDIDDASNVTINIDAALYGNLISNNAQSSFLKLVDSGAVRVVKNSTPPYGSGTAQTGVSINIFAVDTLDLMKKYIETKITGPNVASKPYRNFLSSENGLPVLNISHESGTTTYYEFAFLGNIQNLLHGGIGNRVALSFMTEIIYRATVLVDVTSENLSTVICKGRGFINVGGGEYLDFITPTVGMAAGTTTGWIRKVFTGEYTAYALSNGAYMALRNCKLEIAMFKMSRRNVKFDDEIFVDGNGVLKAINPANQVFKMPISAANDTLATMTNIVTNCENIVVTPKNIYRYMNGAVREMMDERRKSGTTAQRPTLAAGDAGFVYYDTTLTKAIIWNGSAWVNMDGTALS